MTHEQTAASEPAAGTTRTLEKAGIVLVYVPAGEFAMGCAADDSEAYSWEKPAHTVFLEGYWIGQTEVTNAQYRRFIEAGGYSSRAYWTAEWWEVYEPLGLIQPSEWNNARYNAGEQPVVGVSWYEAAAFAKWAGGRLPTEAEWEYAARGGPLSEGYRYAGSDDPNEVAWYADNSEIQPRAVGQKKANELGLYDMSGNALEWCADWYDSGYYSTSPRENPQGPASGKYRVLRGGSRHCKRALLRCASRHNLSPGSRHFDYGFRIVVAP